MWVFVLWVALCYLVSAIAFLRGWSDVTFFALSMFLSPLVGLVAALALPSRVEANLVKQGTLVHCPHCHGLIRAEATICKHCHDELAGELTLYEGNGLRVTNRGIGVVGDVRPAVSSS
jgi:hypothetical protein